MLLDTSGLLSFLHKNEAQHAESVRLIMAAPSRLTHSLILAELVALLERYPPLHAVTLVSAAGMPGEARVGDPAVGVVADRARVGREDRDRVAFGGALAVVSRKTRADFGRSCSCLYMRTTSAAALLTNKSTWSSAWIMARHSLKKCPEPVSAQAHRGVLTLAIAGILSARGWVGRWPHIQPGNGLRPRARSAPRSRRSPRSSNRATSTASRTARSTGRRSTYTVAGAASMR